MSKNKDKSGSGCKRAGKTSANSSPRSTDMASKSSRVYIKTFGCQMNARDSELVAGQFLSRGYKLVDSAKEANVILLNTCSVREHAEHKVWSELGVLKRLKIRNPKHEIRSKSKIRNSKFEIRNFPIIGVIGCMAKNLGAKIIERKPYVDLVVGPNDLAHIYDYVKKIQKDRKQLVEVSSAARDKSFYRHLYHQNKKHSYVNISEGCSNFCSYCVVPYVRGRHRSRLASDILKEVRELVKDGISSITLLGQNVNDFSSKFKVKGLKVKKVEFVELVELVSGIKGVKELSFVTSHPKDIDFRLFDLMAQKKNIIKYLHLPVQSGSNKILKLMNRRYTRQKYLNIIAQYRKKIPNGILATDVIVGFPGEAKKDFKDTLELFKKVKFNFAYIFKYSPRPHTKARDLVDDVSLAEKERRHGILLDLVREFSKRRG